MQLFSPDPLPYTTQNEQEIYGQPILRWCFATPRMDYDHMFYDVTNLWIPRVARKPSIITVDTVLFLSAARCGPETVTPSMPKPRASPEATNSILTHCTFPGPRPTLRVATTTKWWCKRQVMGSVTNQMLIAGIWRGKQPKSKVEEQVNDLPVRSVVSLLDGQQSEGYLDSCFEFISFGDEHFIFADYSSALVSPMQIAKHMTFCSSA